MMDAPPTCPDTARLQRFLLGADSGPEAEHVEAHVAGCPHCLTALAALRADDALVQALRTSGESTAPPYGDLAAAAIPVLKRLRPSERTRDWADRGGDSTLTDGGPVGFAFFAPPQDPAEIGRLGKYQVIRRLGAGGMGMVFLARDPVLKRDVALKVIQPDLVKRPDVHDRFLREAQAVAALEHDNVVTIFDVSEDRGVPFLAMQLLRGETLEARLARHGGPAPTAEVLRVGREVAAGLAAAHARGLVHRDIKPSNIWIVGEPGRAIERVKVLDFGLVREVKAEGGSSAPGAILGTPSYMAPEQARGQAVDGRADLFSLGCVLYRMATGRLPFGGDDVLSIAISVATDEPPPPRQLNPKLPVPVADLIVRLLAKRPADRPTSAAAVEGRFRALEHTGNRKLLLGVVATIVVAAALVGGTVARWLPRRPIPPLPPEPGLVVVECDEPGVTVRLTRGTDPAVTIRPGDADGAKLAPGDYAVALEPDRPGMKVLPAAVEVKPGELRTVRVQRIGLEAIDRATSEVRAVAFVPAKNEVVILHGGADRELCFWRPFSTEPRKSDRRPNREFDLYCIAVNPAGTLAAAGGGEVRAGAGSVRPSANQQLRLWTAATAERLRVTISGSSPFRALAFSPDGQRLASAQQDGSLDVWDVAATTKGEPAGIWPATQFHGGQLLAVAYLHRANRVVTGGGDHLVVLRDATDDGEGRAVRTFAGHTGAVTAVAVLPDDAGVVSGSADGTVRVWDLMTGAARELAVGSPVRGVAVSPDGKRLLTGADDAAVTLWDVSTGIRVHRFDGHDRAVHAVAFAPDGRRAASGGGDGTVRLWRLPD